MPVALLAVFFAGMNSFLYAAVDRVGLGMAVTIEFLGPLAVALYFSRGAGRGGRGIVCGVLAMAGVVLLARPGPTSDFPGLAMALAAGVCWGGYIVTDQPLWADGFPASKAPQWRRCSRPPECCQWQQ